MGSATRRRGAYGGEYLRAGLRLRVRGERRLAKELVKLGLKRLQKSSCTARLKTLFLTDATQRLCPFYSRHGDLEHGLGQIATAFDLIWLLPLARSNRARGRSASRAGRSTRTSDRPHESCVRCMAVCLVACMLHGRWPS
jgi:hypothetical protein